MSNVLINLRDKIKIYDFSLVLFIFFLLFAPPVIPKINTGLIAACVVAVVLLIKYKKETIQTIKDIKMGYFALILVLFFLYVLIITGVNFLQGEHVQISHYVTLWYRYFLIFPILMISSLFICIKCKKNNYKLYDLVMCYVYAALIQFVLVFLSLNIPALKAFFVSVMYKNTGDFYFGIPWVMERRGFGFSNSFVDTFGFGMGLIASLPLFFIKKDRTYILYLVPCLILISFVNARTGLVVALIGLICSIPHVFNVVREAKIKVCVTIFFSIVLLCCFVGIVYIQSPKTISWVAGDFASFLNIDNAEEITTDQTATVVENNTTEDSANVPESTTNEEDTTKVSEETTTDSSSQYHTTDVLFSSRFWNLPTGLSLFFGTGHSIYGADGYPNSDVGYVNDLWIGGIVGTLILYFAFFVLFKNAFANTQEKNVKLMLISFVIAILVVQIKANAIMFNAGLNTIMPISFFVCSKYHLLERE